MKLWHLTRKGSTGGYDTFSDAVVAAETKLEARNTHPNEPYIWDGKRRAWVDKRTGEPPSFDYGDWVSVGDVEVRELGNAVSGVDAGVICASFHAG